MDCLDRTNVVQSVFSRIITFRQLWKMGILNKPKGTPFESFPIKFEEIFRQAWTNNANVVSILYSGTPALKTDFTLTGKRTPKGAIMDGINSCKRYYINNFCDFHNQDILDTTTYKLPKGQKVRPDGFGKFLGLISATVIGFFILNYVVKWGVGVHDAIPESEEIPGEALPENTTTYLARFLHLLIMFAATGVYMKKLYMK